MSHPKLSRILATGEGAPSIEEKLVLLKILRGDPLLAVDRGLLEEVARLRSSLEQARALQVKVKEVVDRLTAPPWAAAVLIRTIQTPAGPRALVAQGPARRAVGVDADVLPRLRPGDEVFLSSESGAVVSRADDPVPGGEVATFERLLPDGRVVVLARGEETVLAAGGTFRAGDLRQGDRVRWDRTTFVALERLGGETTQDALFEDVPARLSPSGLGGIGSVYQTVVDTLGLALAAPDRARAYGLSGRTNLLLVGPPGTGKTLCVRTAASQLAARHGKRCRFASVKPASWEDPFIGVTQQRIRATFAALRAAAKEEGSWAILFLDEVEAVGRSRGGIGAHHSDKFLAALLAEIQGFDELEGVSLVASTNRKDLIDPALLSRLSDVEIHVPRPDRRAAREIFSVHLAPSVPFSPNGSEAQATREEMIESAVGRLYAPNGGNELALLKFRDATTRTVLAKELMSGRLIEQICHGACRAAALRELRGEPPGVRAADMDGAVSDALEKLRTTLTPANAGGHLADLPHDKDVVAVESIRPAVRSVRRYVDTGSAT